MEFRISQIEKRELLKAWGALSFAFAIVLRGGFSGLSFDIGFIIAFAIAGLTVGIGFIAHELSHKFLAQKYGCWAEFRAFNQMLLMAIFFSFFGFILAAPGGVFIKGKISKEQNGKVSAAGPAANIVIAFLFFLFMRAFPSPIIFVVSSYGMLINSWLALFNMIPFSNFDGRKVLAWNKLAYGILVVASLMMMFLSNEIMAL